MEATHYQVMVRVVSCVPDFQVLEQTNVCAQDVIGLVSHLLSTSLLGPCMAVLKPRLMQWEEVSAHNLYP